MPPDQWSLYSLMLKSRLLEEAVVKLWHDGLISGEMHLGTGEEAVNAGVVAHLREGDAMALDHRGTAALMMRGVDPVLILREMLGRPDGLCGGKGGHMHLFSKEHLAASSGIVGASGPTASGFALSAQYLRPGAVAVAFFGEGAKGAVPKTWEPLPIGKAILRHSGDDVTIVSAGLSVHRAAEAAEALETEGISASVMDLRTVSPLDKTAICEAVSKTGRLLVVDEDYEAFGLSGELAAILLEAGISCKYARVCTRTTIPYARHLEDLCLPNAQRICEGARRLMR